MKLTEKQLVRIKQHIELENATSIVRIDVSHENENWSNHESNFNIYCIDQNCNIIWQVKEIKTHPVSIEGETDPFYYLGKNSKNDIIADRFSGFVYKINPDTREATRIGFHK